MTTAFKVPDMSCGHCVATITKALQAADPAAAVRIELDACRVEVDSATLAPDALAGLIRAAGYTPQPVPA